MSSQPKSNPAGRMFLLLVILVLCLTGAQLSAQDKDPNHLSGGWAITFTLPENPLLPTTIHILGNFTTDGSFIFSDSLGKYGPPQPNAFNLPTPFTQSPGHGQWVRTAKGQFIIDSWHIVFDNNGNFFGVSRGRATIEYDPKTGEIHGSNFLQLTPQGGEPLPGLPGTITGYRLPIEPPPPAP